MLICYCCTLYISTFKWDVDQISKIHLNFLSCSLTFYRLFSPSVSSLSAYIKTYDDLLCPVCASLANHTGELVLKLLGE